MFAPSRSRSTSDASPSILASAVSRDFRRIAYNIVLGGILRPSRMFGCHSFNVVVLLTLLPLQRRVVCLVRMTREAYQWSILRRLQHMLHRCPPFAASSVDVTAQNIARNGSFTSQSVLYRTRLGIRAFSVQPNTLNNIIIAKCTIMYKIMWFKLHVWQCNLFSNSTTNIFYKMQCKINYHCNWTTLT